MTLHPERLPADPTAGAICCRTCLRKLTAFGYAAPGCVRTWRCRRCAVRRAVAAGDAGAPGECEGAVTEEGCST